MKTINVILNALNDEQKQLLADTIHYGSWGSTDEYFEGEIIGVYGYITDRAYKGGHFERKSLSSRFRSLYKALGLKGNKYCKRNDTMVWYYEWWGEGTESILLIREELTDQLEQWAREYNK